MWPFKSKKVPEDLTERTERLEKRMNQLEIEWTDTYDKFRRLHMRVAKQAQRAEQASVETEESQPAERENGTVKPGPSSLSPRQLELQARILARRQHLPMKGGEQ